MSKHPRKRNRRGSALLICTLAATVLSMATIAIIRSNQRSVARVDANRTAIQGRLFADGLLQRSLAMLRVDPKLSGEIRDKYSKHPEQRIELRPLTSTTTMIQVFLYEGSKIPAVSRIVDIESLANGGNGVVSGSAETVGMKPVY
ncbi:hypothetical protein [Rubripirellula reticaptiva]|uniref:hypothetical protein n=1 Tax=Rubripirellula reticaptiva TaxID=2528013 RepID=UPI0011B4A0AE|nr:hypothetical protein [Rubripirellula reticaptiva]